MSRSLLESVPFCFPERPHTTTPLEEAQALHAAIKDAFPYKNNGVYRPELVALMGGGNCYAQALGGLMIADQWRIPAGILLTSGHASLMTVHDEEEVFSVDPISEAISLAEEARAQDRSSAHRTLLDEYLDCDFATALWAGNCLKYFYIDDAIAPKVWQVETASEVGALPNNENAKYRQLVVDAERGKDTLVAIGDLLRYSQTDFDAYIQNYDRLSASVPPFIELPTPEY